MKLLAFLALALHALDANARQITHVECDAPSFDAAAGEEVTIRFRLSEPSRVRLRIFDGRNLQVRKVEGASDSAGVQSFSWDGKDERGRLVPPEAYTYTLEAENADGTDRVTWDLADRTGGESVVPREVVWDAVTGTVSYVLPTAARVNVRIGLKNHGPLLRTLVDWVPRPAGEHRELWDGFDSAGVLDVSKDPRLEIVARAFSLSRNTILVLPPPEQVEFVSDLPLDAYERPREFERAHRMYAPEAQSIERRRDFPLSLQAVGGAIAEEDGVLIVTESVAFQIDVPDKERARALEERFEAIFFVDGEFVFENEVGFLPMTWHWDPDGIDEGVHYITANLRGYEGHFGMTTLRVYVRHESSP